MPSSEFELRFSIRGPDLDPERLSATLGIVPSKSFHVGERPNRLREVAGWDWYGDLFDSDSEPAIRRFVELFSPHRQVLRSLMDAGATATLLVVGQLGTIYVANEAEAERLGHMAGDTPWPFEPFLESGRLALRFDSDALGFLGSISASLDTGIYADLDDVGSQGLPLDPPI